MNIAWFGHKARGRGDGLITYSREVTRQLRARGQRVTFFYHAPEDTAGDPNSVRIGSLRAFHHDLIPAPGAREIILEKLAADDVAVAHVSLSFSLLDLSLPDLCHSLGIPIVATLHVPYDRRPGLWASGTRVLYRFFARTLARYDAAIVFSVEQRNLLVRYGLTAEKVAVIPNGVDQQTFSPGPSEYKAEIGAELLVVYCGRVDPEKHVRALLDAWLGLGLPADHKLVVVGSGRDYEPLQKRYDAHEQITFTGLITDRGRLLEILRAADIFVLPSMVEGLSLSMLEAMACGTAVIATDVGSDGEALGGAGLLVDPGKLSAQLPLALDTLVRFPRFRGELSVLARQRVEQRYALDATIQRMLDLYDDTRRGMQYRRNELIARDRQVGKVNLAS